MTQIMSVKVAIVVHGTERFGLLNGLAKDTTVSHKGRCSTCIVNYDNRVKKDEVTYFIFTSFFFAEVLKPLPVGSILISY